MAPARDAGGIRTREFSARHAGGEAPAVLFVPEGHALSTAGPGLPVVLVQHGGSSHKSGQDVLDLAEVFVRRHGLALVAMDGPVHGSRREAGVALDERLRIRDRFLALWREESAHVGKTTADWLAVIGALSAMPGLDVSRLAWVGVSMGTAYGLPLLAARPGFCAAAVGMWGLSYPNSARLAADAAQLGCPVLFQQKWGDELFDRDGQLALFDHIGSTDKRLHVYPGGHSAVQGEQMLDIERFVVERLTAR